MKWGCLKPSGACGTGYRWTRASESGAVEWGAEWVRVVPKGEAVLVDAIGEAVTLTSTEVSDWLVGESDAEGGGVEWAVTDGRDRRDDLRRSGWPVAVAVAVAPVRGAGSGVSGVAGGRSVTGKKTSPEISSRGNRRDLHCLAAWCRWRRGAPPSHGAVQLTPAELPEQVSWALLPASPFTTHALPRALWHQPLGGEDLPRGALPEAAAPGEVGVAWCGREPYRRERLVVERVTVG